MQISAAWNRGVNRRFWQKKTHILLEKMVVLLFKALSSFFFFFFLGFLRKLHVNRLGVAVYHGQGSMAGKLWGPFLIVVKPCKTIDLVRLFVLHVYIYMFQLVCFFA